MEGTHEVDWTIMLDNVSAEAAVLHEVIAFSEWGDRPRRIELRGLVEHKASSDVQDPDARDPALGTHDYQDTVDRD